MGEDAGHGVRINWVAFSDEETGEELWRADWAGNADVFASEISVDIPTRVVSCPLLMRTINFSSSRQFNNFRMIQRVMVGDHLLESYGFNIGFVIPDSTNSWSSTFSAAGDMVPPAQLSGKMVIHSDFHEGDALIASQRTRCFFV
ncbi:Phosphodiesterase delta-like protein [Diplonema papillatum]|nr:Phosphodiesterase delta-like protein [Diplonema papillatum]KAJ9457046.1 Phosphodiesterase delta-like protein [Diplonema papillatum]